MHLALVDHASFTVHHARWTPPGACWCIGPDSTSTRRALE